MSGKAGRSAGATAYPAMPPARLSRAEARRLLDRRPVRHEGNNRLAQLLAAAVAPVPTASEREASDAGLSAVLAAFNAVDVSGRRDRAPSWHGGYSRTFAVKCAAALVLVSGAGMAAAGGALPDSAQRIAHELFGGIGVPAPTFSAAPNRGLHTLAGPRVTPSASPPHVSAAVVNLCVSVTDSGADWRDTITPADKATLVAAAGDDQNIETYCARLLTATATSAPSATTGTGSSAASASPTTPRDTHQPVEPSSPPASASAQVVGKPTPTPSRTPPSKRPTGR